MKLFKLAIVLGTPAFSGFAAAQKPPTLTEQCRTLSGLIIQYKPGSARYNPQYYEHFSELFKKTGCGDLPAIVSIASRSTVSPTTVTPTIVSPTTVSSVSTSTAIPPVKAGPGVCAIYRSKIAAIQPQPRQGHPTSPDYAFFYFVLRENKCNPLPPVYPSYPGSAAIVIDPPQCAIARTEIYAVDPNSERYKQLRKTMVEKKCKDLPPAPSSPSTASPVSPSATGSLVCDTLTQNIKSFPDTKSQGYREIYNVLKMLQCNPLPAAPQ